MEVANSVKRHTIFGCGILWPKSVGNSIGTFRILGGTYYNSAQELIKDSKILIPKSEAEG